MENTFTNIFNYIIVFATYSFHGYLFKFIEYQKTIIDLVNASTLFSFDIKLTCKYIQYIISELIC